jgi:hypothetical protein
MIADVLCSYKGFPNFNTLAPIIMNCAMVIKNSAGEYVWTQTRPLPDLSRPESLGSHKAVVGGSNYRDPNPLVSQVL